MFDSRRTPAGDDPPHDINIYDASRKEHLAHMAGKESGPLVGPDKREHIAEAFDTLISLMSRFQRENGFDTWRSGPEARRDMLVRALFATISELCEAGDEVNKWWKKGSREPEALVIKREKIIEEMMDSLHFLVVALLILGADGKEVADAYLGKMAVNFDRQQRSELGYV